MFRYKDHVEMGKSTSLSMLISVFPFLAQMLGIGFVLPEYFSICGRIPSLSLSLCASALALTFFHHHSGLGLGFVAGTPGAASRATRVFPGFNATPVQLEHVHGRPDCPGDLFSHSKPLPKGQPLSQHG